MCGWLRSHDRFWPLKIVYGLDFYSNGRKNESFYVSLRSRTIGIHIRWKCFAFDPIRKSGKFQRYRERQSTSSLASSYTVQKYIVAGVGYCFICVWAFQSLCTDKRSIPHFLCLYLYLSSLGLGWVGNNMPNKKTLIKDCYLSPSIEVIELCIEGVLCASGDTYTERLEENLGSW